MTKFNLLLTVFFGFSFLLSAQYPQIAIPAHADQDEVEGPQFDRGYLSPDFVTDPEQLDPDKLVYLTIPQLEDLIVQEQEKIQACRTRATEILNIISDEDNPSSDALDEIDKNMDCMRTHKANIMLIKKEINKRLTEVSSDDPDRKKLKKAQGQANKAIKEAQDALVELKEAQDAQIKSKDAQKK